MKTMPPIDARLVARAKEILRFCSNERNWYRREQYRKDNPVCWNKCSLRFAILAVRAEFRLSEERAIALLTAVWNEMESGPSFRSQSPETGVTGHE